MQMNDEDMRARFAELLALKTALEKDSEEHVDKIDAIAVKEGDLREQRREIMKELGPIREQIGSADREMAQIARALKGRVA